jgi:chromate transporter
MSACVLLFWTFFKISLFSIGGGYNMVPLMQHEVESHAWLPEGRFMDLLAISEATPGPVAVNLATFAGYEVAGVAGSVAATVGVCLPGALLLFALGAWAMPLRDTPAFRAAMRGLRPALVGLLSATAIRLGIAIAPAPTTQAIVPTLIFAAVLALNLRTKAHPLALLTAAAAAGVLASLA